MQESSNSQIPHALLNAIDLPSAPIVRSFLRMIVVLLKLLIVVAVVGLLRSSERFRSMSTELDEAALASLRKLMLATEESGYPRETIPLLIAFSTITFIAMMVASGLFSR